MEQDISWIPRSEDEAADRVMKLVEAARSQSLKAIADNEFKKLWASVAYLYPGLHPDDAADHGTEICADSREDHDVLQRYPELGSPYYARSGWPVELEPVVDDVWSRYEQQRLDDEEMYCTSSQRASLNLGAIDETFVA